MQSLERYFWTFKVIPLLTVMLIACGFGWAQSPEVMYQKVIHADYTQDIFYFQKQSIPRILYAASTKAKNTRDMGGFYAIGERQGHLMRSLPVKPGQFAFYHAHMLSTPGVLAPVVEQGYPYGWPLTQRGGVVRVGTAFSTGDSGVDQDGRVVILSGQPGDTVFASREGVVLNDPRGSPVPGRRAMLDISHPDGGEMHYGNLDQNHLFVGFGDRVNQGQPLGLLSDAGQLEMYLTILDTLPSPHEFHWKGTVFRPLYTHILRFSFANGELPVSKSSSEISARAGDGEGTSRGTQEYSRADFFGTVDQIRDVHQVADQLNTYEEVWHKWFGILRDSTKTSLVMTQMTYGVLSGAPVKYMRKFLRKKMAVDEEAAEQFGEWDKKKIEENALLIMLKLERFVQFEDQVTLDTTSIIWDELDWYDIRDGMWVAEIGAGEGLISYVLASHYPRLRVCYQDIEWSRIYFGKKIYDTDPLVCQPLRLFPVWGRKKATKLESFRFDRIIIRDAFHHFKKKEDMLASILKSMDGDSQLIINEPMGELDPDTGCDDTLTSAQIRQILLANGLAILEEHVIEEEKEIWFRCRLRD